MNRDDRFNTTFGDIGRRSVHGGLTLLGSNALQLAIMVGTTMVLARVLTPRDFGLMAMGTILISLVAPIRNFGLPPAIVHQPQLDDGHVSELFWLNLKLNAVLAAAMVAMTPVIAWFFDEPSLVWIILVLTFGFLVRGTANLQPGLLQRQMHFGVISVVKAGSLLAGATAGIGYALWTGSYWALVLQQLVVALTQTGLLWLACPWRPTRPRNTPKTREGSVRAMVTYGRNTSFTRMVNEAGKQMDRVLLGRFVGVEQLGLYQNALRWASAPATQLLQPLRTVAISGFSRLQDHPQRYRPYARNAFTVMLTLALPTFVFLAIEAREVVLLLLGSQWVDAVPLFQILAIAMIFTTPDRIAKWVYLGEGHTARGLRWSLMATPCLIFAMIAGLPWGAAGVATGFCAAKAMLAYPSVWFALRTSPLRGSDFWSVVWRPAIATGAGAGVLLILGSVPLLSLRTLPIELLLDGAMFALVFAAVWLCLPGGIHTTGELLRTLKPSEAGSTAPRG